VSAGGVDLGSAHGSIEIEVAKAIANIDHVQRSLNAFGKSSTSAFDKLQGTGRVMTGFGVAVLGGLGLAVNTAANFEEQMSAVAAVTNATGAEFEALRQKALDLGKSTSFSASDAAQAIEELGKAGVSTEDILRGAADGAVALAAAAGVAVPQAAMVMSNALNIFNLSGDQAVHVADVFAAAANKSASDVTDLAAGMAQAGAVAASFGLTIEDTAGALALFADNGLRGSDAGTSLKTALLSMLDPTAKQADLMDQLGLSFFDAQGQFIGLDGVAGQLRDRLAGLTEEERNTALAVLFGSDAVRAANILYKEGTKGVQEYREAVDDAGAAQRAAATRLDNFKGSLEQLKGSVETLAIVIGSALLPPLRTIVDAATAAVNALLELPEPLQKIAAFGGAAAGVIATLAGGFILLAPQVIAAVQAFKAMLPFLLGISGPVALIVGALAALGVAYKVNLFGFRDAVSSVANSVQTTFGKIVAAAGPIRDVIAALFGTKFQAGGKFTSQSQAIQAAVTSLSKVFGLNFEQVRAVQTALVQLAKPLRQLRNTYRDVTQAAALFFDIMRNPQDIAAMAELSKRLGRLFGKDLGRQLTTSIVRLGRAFKGFGAAVEQATRFDLGKWLSLQGMLNLLVRGVTDFTQFLRRELIPALGPILLAAITGTTAALAFLGAHMTEIAVVVSGLARLVGSTLAAPFRTLAALLRGDFAGAVDAALAPLRTLLDGGGDLVGWALRVGPPVVSAWASDLWDWLKTDGIPGFFDLVGEVTGWALTVGAPRVFVWAEDAWAWLKERLFGGASSRGDGTEMWEPFSITNWILNVLEPTVTGWLKDTAGDAWAGVKAAAGWAFAGTAALGDWTLDTVAPLVTGWLKDTAADAWAGLKAAAGWAWSGLVDLGDWTLSTIVPTVTGWLKDVASDVWAGLKAAAGWAWDNTADLGTVTISAGIAFAQDAANDLWSLANDGAAWLKTKLDSGLTAVVALGAVSVAAVVGFADDAANDLHALATDGAAWLKPKLSAGLTEVVDVGTVFVKAIVLLSGDVEFTRVATAIKDGVVGAIGRATDFGAGIVTAVKATIAGIADWNITAEDVFNAGTAVGSAIHDALAKGTVFAADVAAGLVTGIKTAVTSINLTEVDWSGLPKKIADGAVGVLKAGAEGTAKVAAAIGLFIAGAVTGIVFGEDVKFDDVATAIAGGIALAMTKVEGLGQGILNGIATAIGAAIDAGDFLSEGLTIAKQAVSAVASGFTGADFSSVGTAIWNGIKGAVTAAIPSGFIQTIVDAIIGSEPSGTAALGSGAVGAGGSQVMPLRRIPKIPRRAEDSTATFAADTTAVAEAAAFVMSLGKEWEAARFTADLLADPQAVKDAGNLSRQIGTQWDSASFSADFTADTRGVRDAVSLAFSLGNQWDGAVFSSRLTMDTSALDRAVEHAAAAAQQIRDLLPSSPAKKGPLSKPISWDYIADGLRRSLAGMGATTETAMARVNRALTPGVSAAFSPNGAHLATAPSRGTTVIVNHHNYALSEGDLVRVMRESRQGREAHEWISDGARYS
jgi:TP901 family phage tail tape measure protein